VLQVAGVAQVVQCDMWSRLLPFAASGAFFLTVFGIVLAMLPRAETYPIPTNAITGIVEIYKWMYTLNMIMPVDTLAQVLFYVVVTLFFTRVVYPILFWVTMTLTGGGQ